METEETVKEECVAMSKTKRIWLAFVDIVLFTVLFMIFLFLFAIPFAIAFPELKTQAGGMSVYLMMLNEVLMLASGLIAACMVLGFRKLPFSGLGLSLKGLGQKPAERSFVCRVLVCSWFWLVFIVGGCGSGRGLVFSHFVVVESFALFFSGSYGRSYWTRFHFRAYAGWRRQ